MAFPWRKTANAMARSEDVEAVFQHRGAECQSVLTGRITIDSSPDLRETLLTKLATPSCRTLTIDFDKVSYVDTSGLAMLVEILKAARTQGKTVQLTGLKERPRYLLEATRLLRFFHEGTRAATENNDSSESPQ